MGKWNRRYYAGSSRRRKYQDYQWSPPRDEPCPDPETEDWQDNVPMWEKKFCYLVGRMPWKKVLSTKNFMNCQSHSNVLSWDDSAGKEAFLTAKKRFWEEFNGLPCETQLPNPDTYIDEIDWNPYIDPDLARECDKEYFNPDDKCFLPSTARSKGNCGWSEDVDDPWERGYVQSFTEKSKPSGWGQWDEAIKNARKSTNNDDPWESHIVDRSEPLKDKCIDHKKWDSTIDITSKSNANNNPWENHHIQGNEAANGNSWGGDWNKASVLKSSKYLNGNSDPWENHHIQGNEVSKDNSWGGEWNKSWIPKPNDYSCTINNCTSDGSTWRKGGCGLQDRGASSWGWKQEGKERPFSSYWSIKNDRGRPQEYRSYRGGRMANGRGNSWGPKPRDKYNFRPIESVNFHRDPGQLNAGCRKREGPDYYAANYKGPRLHGDEQSFHHGHFRRDSFGGQ